LRFNTDITASMEFPFDPPWPKADWISGHKGDVDGIWAPMAEINCVVEG
jgi:hypothetical protein